jgi:hypothetical protein
VQRTGEILVYAFLFLQGNAFVLVVFSLLHVIRSYAD